MTCLKERIHCVSVVLYSHSLLLALADTADAVFCCCPLFFFIIGFWHNMGPVCTGCWQFPGFVTRRLSHNYWYWHPSLLFPPEITLHIAFQRQHKNTSKNVLKIKLSKGPKIDFFFFFMDDWDTAKYKKEEHLPFTLGCIFQEFSLLLSLGINHRRAKKTLKIFFCIIKWPHHDKKKARHHALFINHTVAKI